MASLHSLQTHTCPDLERKDGYVVYDSAASNAGEWTTVWTTSSADDEEWDDSTTASHSAYVRSAGDRGVKTLHYSLEVHPTREELKELEVDEEELAYLREMARLKRMKELAEAGKKLFFSPPKKKFQPVHAVGFHRRICTQSCPRQNWKAHKKEGL